MIRLPTLIIGDPEPRPTLSFRLSQWNGQIDLVAKHSDDAAEQTLLELRYHPTTGVLECVTRDIHAPRLAEVLNVPLKQGIRCRFEDKSS
jgi:hypothetical protein